MSRLLSHLPLRRVCLLKLAACCQRPGLIFGQLCHNSSLEGGWGPCVMCSGSVGFDCQHAALPLLHACCSSSLPACMQACCMHVIR